MSGLPSSFKSNTEAIALTAVSAESICASFHISYLKNCWLNALRILYCFIFCTTLGNQEYFHSTKQPKFSRVMEVSRAELKRVFSITVGQALPGAQGEAEQFYNTMFSNSRKTTQAYGKSFFLHAVNWLVTLIPFRKWKSVIHPFICKHLWCPEPCSVRIAAISPNS